MERFLACQPIFNSHRTVYGYELLHRSGPQDFFGSADPDAASASTFDSVMLFGIDRLIPGCRAFVNCTRESLLREFATILSRHQIVIEILETVEIDPEVFAACRRLQSNGYLLPLDDFEDTSARATLVDLTDFIKVDLIASSHDEQLRMAREFLPRNILLVAEEVETYEDFRRCDCSCWGCCRRWMQSSIRGSLTC